MNTELIREVQSSYITKEMPVVRTGMEVEIHQVIKEGSKERTQKFRGLVIRTKGKTLLDKCIVVRRDVDGIGIDKTFAIYSPTVSHIEVIRSFKVRRKNISYIRALTGKSARLKEIK